MVSLEQRVQASVEGPASQVKAGISSAECSDAEACEPLKNLQNADQITEPNSGQSKVSLHAWLDVEHMVK